MPLRPAVFLLRRGALDDSGRLGRFLEKKTGTDGVNAWSGVLSTCNATVPDDVCKIRPVGLTKLSFEILDFGKFEYDF